MATTENFKLLTTLIAVWAGVTGAATTYLFFLRVRAVYLESRRVTVLFGALWLATQAMLSLASATIRPGQFHYDFSKAV